MPDLIRKNTEKSQVSRFTDENNTAKKLIMSALKDVEEMSQQNFLMQKKTSLLSQTVVKQNTQHTINSNFCEEDEFALEFESLNMPRKGHGNK